MADTVKKDKPILETQESLYKKAMQKKNADQVIVQHAYKIDNYLIAAAMFDEVGEYEDAPQQAEECRALAEQTREEEKEFRYTDAVRRRKNASEEHDLQKVMDLFESLGDYKDAKEQASQCRQEMTRLQKKFNRKRAGILAGILAVVGGITAVFASGLSDYILGIGYLKAGMYAQARTQFVGMGDFLNSEELAEEAKYRILCNAKKGQYVYYGDFQWKILDREDDVLTAIASDIGPEHLFNHVPFEENSDVRAQQTPDQTGDEMIEQTENQTDEEITGQTAVLADEESTGQTVDQPDEQSTGKTADQPGEQITWENSTLRAWLNGEVVETCFSDIEREHMLPEGDDLLNLLSAQEAQQYMDQLVGLSLDYWLSTPGQVEGTMAYMTAAHYIRTFGCPADTEEMAVRPVIRIDTTGFLKE